MERCHKKNIILISVCVGILILLTIAKYGVGNKILLAIICLLSGEIIALISYKCVKNDLIKAIGIIESCGIAAIIYSCLVGGSSTAFVACFVLLGMSAMYFNRAITTWTTIPLSVFMFIVSLVFPAAIEGPGGTVVGAISKVILFVTTILIMKEAINVGSQVSKKSYIEMDNIAEILARIDATSEKVEEVIQAENSLINNIDVEFNSIAEKMTSLHNYSEDNKEKLVEIQNSIGEQNVSIHNLDEKMENVGQLAVRMTT